MHVMITFFSIYTPFETFFKVTFFLTYSVYHLYAIITSLILLIYPFIIPPYNFVVRVYCNQLVRPADHLSGRSSDFLCPPDNLMIFWRTVFIFGIEVSHDY
jgi:hypothetical protein